MDDLRLRVHNVAEEEKYSALLELDSDDTNEQKVIDEIFRGLLDQVGAREITEIEPYD
jgi:hypothetical protein